MVGKKKASDSPIQKGRYVIGDKGFFAIRHRRQKGKVHQRVPSLAGVTLVPARLIMSRLGLPIQASTLSLRYIVHAARPKSP